MRTTTVLLVIIIAFVACYTWAVLRMGDEHADEPLTYFKEDTVGDRAYLDGAKDHANLGLLFRETERPEEAKKEFEVAKELFKNQGKAEHVKKVEELLSHT